MKLSRLALGLLVPGVMVACASAPASQEPGLSAEMQEAIDTYVRIQADPVIGPDGGPIGTNNPQRSGSSNSSSKVGGIDPVDLGGALKAGAANIPSGGAASGPTGAGNGGAGSPVLSGGAGSATGAGNGGAAVGSFAAGGGGASFADAACYLIGNLCRYISRCASTAKLEGVCQVPSTCPALVASALSKANTTIPPQAAVTVRCFGDALGSASCVRGDLGESLKSSFQRCGISVPKGN
jgi:hypothetical protein